MIIINIKNWWVTGLGMEGYNGEGYTCAAGGAYKGAMKGRKGGARKVSLAGGRLVRPVIRGLCLSIHRATVSPSTNGGPPANGQRI